jgi:hypothetical protein
MEICVDGNIETGTHALYQFRIVKIIKKNLRNKSDDSEID